MEGTTKNGNGIQKNGGNNPMNMLDAVASLKQAGFEQEKAEAVVRMQYQIIESNLATKYDLELVRLEIEQLQSDTIKAVKGLDLKITNLQKSLSREMIIVAGCGVVAGLGLLATLGKLGWLAPLAP